MSYDSVQGARRQGAGDGRSVWSGKGKVPKRDDETWAQLIASATWGHTHPAARLDHASQPTTRPGPAYFFLLLVSRMISKTRPMPRTKATRKPMRPMRGMPKTRGLVPEK